MMLLPWHTEYFQLRPRCWLQGQRAQQLSRWCLGQSTEVGSCSWRAAWHSWSSSARRSWKPRLTRCPHCSHTSGLNCLPTCLQRLWSWISRPPMNIDLLQSNSQWQNTTRVQFGTVVKLNFFQYTIQYHILSLGVSFYYWRQYNKIYFFSNIFEFHHCKLSSSGGTGKQSIILSYCD